MKTLWLVGGRKNNADWQYLHTFDLYAKLAPVSRLFGVLLKQDQRLTMGGEATAKEQITLMTSRVSGEEEEKQKTNRK